MDHIEIEDPSYQSMIITISQQLVVEIALVSRFLDIIETEDLGDRTEFFYQITIIGDQSFLHDRIEGSGNSN